MKVPSKMMALFFSSNIELISIIHCSSFGELYFNRFFNLSHPNQLITNKIYRTEKIQ
jgi:hypothetical protein